MDTTHHIHWMLDRIREQQHLHTEALRQISERQKLIIKLLKEKPSSRSTREPRLMPLSKLAVQSAAQWGAGILCCSYVAKGGDIGQLLQILLKAL
jgi:hypothetical protein